MSDINNNLPPQAGENPDPVQHPVYTPPQESTSTVAPDAKMNTLAIVSLVSSFFIGLAGVITGHIARKQIRERGERGDGLAIAGLIVGYINIAAAVIGVMFAIFAIVIGGLFAASNSENMVVSEGGSSIVEEQPNDNNNGNDSNGSDVTACEELMSIGTEYLNGNLTDLEAEQALADLYVLTQDTEFGVMLDEASQTGDTTALFEYCGAEASLL